MINPPLQLDEANVADLEAYANPADVRWDLHAFADYVRDHEIKRGHRDNRIPQTHLPLAVQEERILDLAGPAPLGPDGGPGARGRARR